MRIETEAIICGVRSHGEHGAVVRALTPSEGMQPGFVRGGRSRRLRPVLVPGNTVQAEYRSRTDEQLAQLSVELVHSRAFLLAEALPSEAIAWATSLTAAVLPDGQPYPQLYQALEGLLGAIEAAPSARGWAAALVRYELLLLSELGFGLDLGECAVTGGREALAYVSPRSGRAVSSEGADGYRDRLLVLPAYLQAGGQPDWPEIGHGLKLTGHFLDRDLLIGRAAEVRASRDRLIDRLRRIAPLPS